MAQFRTKARAVELLGKNQIADLPTAICELWKNGYDAYADNIKCKLYKKGYKGLENPIFTLSDDGCGMSYKDLIEKWIVLGTDSKTDKKVSDKGGLDVEDRVPLGEKGIGRLSVAYLGSHMLLITKKANEQLQVLFFNWDILKNRDLYLDDISIPIKSLEHAVDIGDAYEDLINQFKNNFIANEGAWEKYYDLKEDIEQQLNCFANFPNILVNEIAKTFSDLSKAQGTRFIIFNPIEELTNLTFSPGKDEGNYNYLRTSLLGLFNYFKSKENKNPVLEQPEFFINSKDGVYDILEKQGFFESDDIERCEFRITGKFDKFGAFQGEVRAYGKPIKYQFKPMREIQMTDYGPFALDIGFNEGERANTTLPVDQWEQFERKFKMFGGLYIYRDNFRVLPYGRSEYDFLKFEERRSKNAGRYMISHRRLIGFIEIDKETNFKLNDKAGREGLVNNKAYKTFVKDLEEFFIDVADRYINRGTEDRKEHLDKVKEEKRKKLLLKEEHNKERKKLQEFRKKRKENVKSLDLLEDNLEKLSNNFFKVKSTGVLSYNRIIKYFEEITLIKRQLIELQIREPKRIILADVDKNNIYNYREKYNKIYLSFTKLDFAVKESATRKALVEVYCNSIKVYKETIKDNILKSDETLEEVFNQFKQVVSSSKGDYLGRFDEVCVFDISGSEISDKEILEQMTVAENKADEIIDEIVAEVEFLNNLEFNSKQDELFGIYKKDYIELKKKADAMHELAQLGMAIEIIDHQFNVLYAQIAHSLSFFKKYVKGDEDGEGVFSQLRTSFEHLENNHRLLTPLYRTMRRSRSEITGKMIYEYVNRFFGDLFIKERINFDITGNFSEYSFFSFESVVYPVFMNIINNAVYWLRRKEEKNIKIDYIKEENTNGKVLIMNSGEKMEYTDLINAFKLFFSRRPGGRGIGLYLAKTNLQQVGYNIYATNAEKYNKLNGACFIIEKNQGE